MCSSFMKIYSLIHLKCVSLWGELYNLKQMQATYV